MEKEPKMNKIIKTYGFMFLGFFLFFLAGYFIADVEINFSSILFCIIFPTICTLINGTAIIIPTILLREKIKLFKWERVIIWIIALSTTISVLNNNVENGISFRRNVLGYSLDLFFGIFLNTIVLIVMFFVINLIYKRFKYSPITPINHNMKETFKIRQGRKGYKKFMVEDQTGYFPSGNKKEYPEGIEKERTVDKEKDLYKERVVDRKTRKIIREVEEPLSQHNHNNMKGKIKKNFKI